MGGWKESLVIVTGDHECGFLTAPGEDPSVPLTNAGPGTLPEMQWNSTGHSAEKIPLYARGRGSRVLLEMVRGTDPVRGPFIDNTDIGRLFLAVVGD
jgi:alkaline phosphatase